MPPIMASRGNSWVPPAVPTVEARPSPCGGRSFFHATADARPSSHREEAGAPREPSFGVEQQFAHDLAGLFTRLPGNGECADCGAASPSWASVNLGVTLCIECAGSHRGLGTHVSRVKSLRLDEWKPEEVRQFISYGGNAKVNRRLLAENPGIQQRPPPSARRSNLEAYIAAKYGSGSRSRQLEFQQASPERSQRQISDGSPQSPPVIGSGGISRLGKACHQGLVIVEALNVELSEARVAELRPLVAELLLSLSIVLSLGSAHTEQLYPGCRRDLLWDTEERWLWCRVYDAGLTGDDLAAEGRIDLFALGGSAAAAALPIQVPLYSADDSAEEEDRDEDDFPRGVWCGSVDLKLTLIDMASSLTRQ